MDEKRGGDSQPLRTTYLQDEKSWRSEGERNMEFQSCPQVSLEPVPLTVVTELPPEPRGGSPVPDSGYQKVLMLSPNLHLSPCRADTNTRVPEPPTGSAPLPLMTVTDVTAECAGMA